MNHLACMRVTIDGGGMGRRRVNRIGLMGPWDTEGGGSRITVFVFGGPLYVYSRKVWC